MAQFGGIDWSKTKLTFKEYTTWPVPRLLTHPDFSLHAMRVAAEITKLNTKQLEQLDVSNVYKI